MPPTGVMTRELKDIKEFIRGEFYTVDILYRGKNESWHSPMESRVMLTRLSTEDKANILQSKFFQRVLNFLKFLCQ